MAFLEIAHFSATLSKQRVWLEKGNKELYSYNEGFKDGILWKFNLYPTSDRKVEGFVEKLHYGKRVEFKWHAAEQAIYGNFLRVSGIEQGEAFSDEFQPFRSTDVAFTLSAKDEDETKLKWLKDAISREKEKTIIFNEKKITFTFETGILKYQDKLQTVQGLLKITEGGILPLEQCAMLLDGIFEREIITWFTYCTNEEKYWNRGVLQQDY